MIANDLHEQASAVAGGRSALCLDDEEPISPPHHPRSSRSGDRAAMSSSDGDIKAVSRHGLARAVCSYVDNLWRDKCLILILDNILMAATRLS